jgi:hypothetical protein
MGEITTKMIDHTDKKWLWSYLNTEDEVEEVCNLQSYRNITKAVL